MKTDLTQSNYSYRLTFSFIWSIYPSRIYRGKNKVHVQFLFTRVEEIQKFPRILLLLTAHRLTKCPSIQITVSAKTFDDLNVASIPV